MPSYPLASRRRRGITGARALFAQIPRQHRPRLLHRLGAMADAVLHLGRNLRKRLRLPVGNEQRIVTKSAAAPLSFQDCPIANGLDAFVQPILVRNGHHAVSVRGAHSRPQWPPRTETAPTVSRMARLRASGAEACYSRG